MKEIKKCETKEEFEALAIKTIQDNAYLIVDRILREKMREKEDAAREERVYLEAAMGKYKECIDSIGEALDGKTDEERKRMCATKVYEYDEKHLSPVTSSESLSKEIAKLQEMIDTLKERLNVLEKQHVDALSLEWIEANNVKKSDVEFSDGDEKPWFNIVDNFIRWLKVNSNKPWAEWNGSIYKTEDLLNDTITSIELPHGKAVHLKD